MKTTAVLLSAVLVAGIASTSSAQSTTGGKSGGSTASTGAGYLTGGKRNPTSSPKSMTIADEGASRDYMYVPPTRQKNRSASPDGSSSTNKSKANSTGSSRQKKGRSGNGTTPEKSNS